jgi:dTDP-4-dehydrorhamnose 3,5-epimerase
MAGLGLFKRLLDAPLVFEDKRGRMEVLYESDEMVLKRSASKKHVMRGLHHQTPPAQQNKIIRVLSGRIIDFVADPYDVDEVVWWSEINPVDQWVQIDSRHAHGFYAAEDVIFEYFCEGGYSEKHEKTFLITDLLERELGLKNIILSDKDLGGQMFGKVLKKFERCD